MFVPALRIAIAKTSAGKRCTLENVLRKAESLESIESTFETRINASKASRGEGPTRLSTAKREQLQELSADGATLQAQQLLLFEAECSATEILVALHSGLATDLKFWSGAAKHTHPVDLPVVQELVEAKRELLVALEAAASG